MTTPFVTPATDSLVAAPDFISDFDDLGNDQIDVSALFSPTMTYRHNLAFTAAGQVRINDIAGADVLVEINTGERLRPTWQFGLQQQPYLDDCIRLRALASTPHRNGNFFC